MTRPFHIFKVQFHLFVIDKDGVQNIKSINRGTVFPKLRSKNYAPVPGHSQQSDARQTESDTSNSHNDRNEGNLTSETNSQTEYAVKRIFGYRNQDKKWQYNVLWYEDRSEHDML